MRKTKIIATLGPSSSSDTMIEELICAGVNTFRLNFSHGTQEDHLRNIRAIRKISIRLNCPVAILQDLQGPKIRTGTFEKGFTMLKKGAMFTITARDVMGNDDIVSTTYKHLPLDVKPKEKIYLNDGLILLEVIKIKGKDIQTRVMVGGKLSDHKGINLPGTIVSAPSLTQKDQDDLKFGLKHDVDFIALSFVRRSNDIYRLKEIIKQSGKHAKVIAKIEKPEGVANIESIIAEADGVMVARGDLAVEMSPEAVPAIQKRIIKLAISSNKIVITATQMLESMTENPSPTRAEASDIANAVYDGTDAIMLSAETASGKYPLECVRMMHKIALRSEETLMHQHLPYLTTENDFSSTLALTGAALYACEEINGKAILVHTRSGHTARFISQKRREMNIIALTPDPKVVNQLALSWGLYPMLMQFVRDTDKLISCGINIACKSGLIKTGDRIIILSGDSFHSGSTNLLKIETVK